MSVAGAQESVRFGFHLLYWSLQISSAEFREHYTNDIKLFLVALFIQILPAFLKLFAET